MLVITGLGLGGAERIVCSLADGLVERGHMVTIVYLTGVAVSLPRHNSIRVVNLGMTRRADFVVSIWRLGKLIRELKPDVVHGNMFHAILLTRLVRTICRIPRLISTVHNAGGADKKSRLWCYRASNFLCTAFTAVSVGAVDSFVRCGAAKIGVMKVVHNGVSVSHFTKHPMSTQVIRDEFHIDAIRPIILAVGRLVAEKDYLNLLRAISSTADLRSVRVLIAGDGPLRDNLQDMAVALGIADQVIFLGVRHDIVALMSASNVFVLPSRSEGYGLVVAEAMACECVVVATDSGGVREVIGDAGFVVPPCDSNALGEFLVRALAMPATAAAELGRKARSRVVEKYSLDSMLDDWIEVYSGRVELGTLGKV